MHRLAETRALITVRRVAVYETGGKTAFSAAAAAAVAIGSGVYPRSADPFLYESDAAPDIEPWRLLSADMLLSVDELAMAPTTDPAPALPQAAAYETVTPVSAPLAESSLPLITAPVREDALRADPAPAPLRFVDDALDLDPEEPFADADAPILLVRRAAPQESTLDALADDLGRPYESADASVHDVSLFLAADDEALSWSITQASPNFGALAYEDERVDIGNLAVGVALNLENARIAAAYVEREVDTRLNARFGEASRDQHYAGVIITVKF